MVKFVLLGVLEVALITLAFVAMDRGAHLYWNSWRMAAYNVAGGVLFLFAVRIEDYRKIKRRFK